MVEPSAPECCEVPSLWPDCEHCTKVLCDAYTDDLPPEPPCPVCAALKRGEEKFTFPQNIDEVKPLIDALCEMHRRAFEHAITYRGGPPTPETLRLMVAIEQVDIDPLLNILEDVANNVPDPPYQSVVLVLIDKLRRGKKMLLEGKATMGRSMAQDPPAPSGPKKAEKVYNCTECDSHRRVRILGLAAIFGTHSTGNLRAEPNEGDLLLCENGHQVLGGE